MKNHFPLHHALLLTVLAVSPLRADTFTVTRLNNTGPGSLPVVISQANATPGNQTIEFAVSGTITLVAPLVTITNSLTINGRVGSPVVISGGGTTPVFTFAAGTTNILNQLTIANGITSGSGAAVNNAGTLLVSGCLFTNCQAPNGPGGAIGNGGTMTIAASTFSGNQAAAGGAIYNSGGMAVADSQLLTNQAGSGGAISSSGSMTVSDSQLLGNQAGSGGAIYNTGQARIERSRLSENTTMEGYGGAVFNSGQFTASSSTWSHNRAQGVSGTVGGDAGENCGGGGGGGGSGAFGGAIYVDSGSLMLTNCTISENASQGGQGGNGGAINISWLSAWMGGNGGSGGGGGGSGGSGASTILPNEYYATPGGGGAFGAGGGGGGAGAEYDAGGAPLPSLYPYGKAGGAGGFGAGYGGYGGRATNSLIGAATMGYGGEGGSGLGGGIFCRSGSVAIVSSTICQNDASGGNGGVLGGWASGIQQGLNGTGVAGGIYNYGATVFLLNTIIANNSTPSTNTDLSGAFVSSGYDLIGNSQGATGLSINDYQDVPADLGPLQDNGGPTLTCALLQGSLAIGGGTSVGAPATDQRGVLRPQGSNFDIGAVEFVSVPVIAAPLSEHGAGYLLSTILDTTNAYQIQGSTNLAAWIELTNCPSGGSLRVLDAATNFDRRFYRAVIP